MAKDMKLLKGMAKDMKKNPTFPVPSVLLDEFAEVDLLHSESQTVLDPSTTLASLRNLLQTTKFSCSESGPNSQLGSGDSLRLSS